MSTRFLKGIIIAQFIILTKTGISQTSAFTLEQGFKNPPSSAAPRTWWHWTNSNITKEGITKDLEWMKRTGIAGFQLADVAAGSGQTVQDKTVFGTSEWLNAVKHTASEAKRLDLEMTLFTSAGWSLTGGPWVKPEQAMKKLVWSKIDVEGGKTFNGMLPLPPSVEGQIRNLARGGNRANAPTFYGDCAVIAFPTPSDEASLSHLLLKATSNAGAIDATALLDDDLNTSLVVKPAQQRGKAWIQYAFDEPARVQAFTIAGTRGIPYGRLLASEDGRSFITLAVLPGKQGYRGGTVRTFSFPETKARYFKLELDGAPMRPADVISETAPQADSFYSLNEFRLHGGARVHRWEDKAGFNFLFEYEDVATPPIPIKSAIAQPQVIDLTSMMGKDGSLHWKMPDGKWTIMRFGYSLTGAKNRPAVPAALGYEVDKLSRKHTEAYMSAYTEPIAKTLGSLYGNTLSHMVLDSWEAGIQNWTDEMLIEFKKRRGYDLTPFLPAMAGWVVTSAEVSDRFLWDFRRTLVDMFAENHYGVVTDFLHKKGIKTYGEAGGVSLETIEDALLYKKYVDIPTGEFWVKDLHPSSMYYEDVRGAASAGHVYGKNIVAAESFTGGNYESPYTLKKISDYWFTRGINRLVFHTSAHQPLDTKPGNTMVGTHLNRNITWAELAKPLMTYMSRNSYMLQQGLYVADFAYLLNEGAPSTMPFWGGGLQPATPKGYDYDYINADALVTRLSVDSSGQLALPDGMRYSVLVLPQTNEMTLPVLRKIRQLLNAGATVVGPKPLKVPGLSDYPNADAELHEMANEVWGDLDGHSRTRRTYGKGKIFWNIPLQQVMSEIKISPDVEYSGDLDTRLSCIHRKTPDADIYFVVNITDTPQQLPVRFRVSGREAERWNPENGEINAAGYQIVENRTTVPLHLKERESLFVVFRNKTTDTARTIAPEVTEVLTTIKGAWDVSFPLQSGAPPKARFEELISWTDHPDSGIKYFSGSATYTKTIEASKSWLRPHQKLLIDLGQIGDMAEVTLNGKHLGLIWKPPYRVDVTDAMKQGKNELAVTVTNQWTNRLIGDRLMGPDKKVLDAYTAPFGGEYTMAPSGLMGPVKIISVSNPHTDQK